MSATILQLDPDVAAKFKFAKALLQECQVRMQYDPQAAMDFAQAAARKYEEALNLARELGLGRDQLRLA
ncbi:hypothetical protein [Rhodoblastus sp.]|uniref:hypothetical protein n=1 Tax=Rhodoblastus sp. TaxID=1962975 RepID=UPI003F98D9EE